MDSVMQRIGFDRLFYVLTAVVMLILLFGIYVGMELISSDWFDHPLRVVGEDLSDREIASSDYRFKVVQ